MAPRVPAELGWAARPIRFLGFGDRLEYPNLKVSIFLDLLSRICNAQAAGRFGALLRVRLLAMIAPPERNPSMHISSV